nr:MAG TPA: hypothetical protein [Caudoviricetes sp.]
MQLHRQAMLFSRVYAKALMAFRVLLHRRIII